MTKDIASVLQSYGIIIGLFVGGYWTYRLYRQYRQKYPRANISHEIFQKKLPNNKIYLHIKTIITNVGNVLICVDSGFTRLTQILPLDKDMTHKIEYFDNKREIDWPKLDKIEILSGTLKCEIEPGEKDEICFEFLLQENIEQIMIYSYIKNIKKKPCFFGLFKKERNIGWQITSIYNLKEVKHV